MKRCPPGNDQELRKTLFHNFRKNLECGNMIGTSEDFLDSRKQGVGWCRGGDPEAEGLGSLNRKYLLIV